MRFLSVRWATLLAPQEVPPARRAGFVGSTTGALGRPAASVGKSARSVGRSAGSVGRSAVAAGRHAASRPRVAKVCRDTAWLRGWERVFGGWAPTLRGSLAVVMLFLCAAVLLVLALGVAGVALFAGLAILAYWLNAAGRLPRA